MKIPRPGPPQHVPAPRSDTPQAHEASSPVPEHGDVSGFALPPELTQSILGRLPFADRRRMAQVSVGWWSAARAVPCTVDAGGDDLGTALAAVGNVSRVIVRRSVTAQQMALIAASAPRVETLEVCGADIGLSLLTQEAASLPGLETLKLSGCTALGRLDPHDDIRLARLRVLDVRECPDLVDATFAALASRCGALEEVRVSHCPRMTGSSFRGATAFASLRSLDLSGCIELSDDAVAELVRACPRLEVLSLSLCDRLSGRALSVLSGLSHLERLDLSGGPSSANLSLEPSSSLRMLDLSRCHDLTDEALARLVGALPGLQDLRIAGCDLVTGAGVDAVLRHPRLVALDLGRCSGVTADVIGRIVANRPTQVELRLSGCAGVSGRALERWPVLGELARLDLSRCRDLSAEGLALLTHRCPNVEVVDLSGCDGLTDDAFRAGGRFGKLRTLDLAACHGLTDASIAFLFRACPSLETLRLNGCRSLIGRPPELPPAIDGLRSLELSGCPRLGDDVIDRLVMHCPGLDMLNLSHCLGVSDDAFAAAGRHERLRVLDASGCARLTDEGVLRLVTRFPNLEELRLADCPRLTAGATLRHLSRLARLRTLDLSGCIGLEDRHARLVVALLPQLERLALRRCPELTAECRIDLARMPRLRQVSLYDED